MAATVNELLGALQKAGVDPNASSLDMSRAIPGLQSQVSASMQQSDPALSGIRDQYRGQLDQIAQMDKQLGGVFGNPSSSLYIEDAGARNNIVSGAHSVGSKLASNTASQGRQRVSQIESDAGQAVQLFKQLQQIKIKEEKIAKKQTKGVTSSAGGGTARKSTSQKVADAQTRKQEVEKQQLYLAGIDPETNKAAADFFLNSFPAKAQEQWIREGQQDQQGQLSNPKPNDLQDYLNYWTQTFKPKKKTTSSAADKMNLLKQSLGL